MSMKKLLLKVARTRKQKEQIERMSETEVAKLLQTMTKKEEK